jgi:hypothetical protein
MKKRGSGGRKKKLEEKKVSQGRHVKVVEMLA